MQTARTAKNGKVEFLRFVFCMMVFLFHGVNVMNDGQARIMFSGRLGVDFFFIVSGYLMAVKLYSIKAKAAEPINIGAETETFFLRKIKCFYPMVAIAFFMTLFIRYFTGASTSNLVKRIVQGLPNMFLVQQTGVSFYTMNGTWYISSMLIAMLILFPLSLKFYDFMKKIGAGLIAFLVLGYLMQYTNHLGSHGTMLNGITLIGNLRAIAVISFGMLSYQLSMYLKTLKFTRLGKCVLSFTEWTLYTLVIIYMTFCEASKYDFYLVFILTLAVAISFSECNYNAKVWNNQFCYFLGKSSLYIYLSHLTVSQDLTFLVGADANNYVRMAVYIVLGLLATVFVWLISELCKKIWTIMKKGLFVSENQ